jgi:hypothetical protein
MYRSVIHQLYAKIPRIKAAASRRVTVAKQQVWSIKILEDMLRESVLGLASDEKVTIYIDALDECEIDQVRSAVDFFEGLSRSATREEKPFFICLSSRYYPQITMQCHAEVKLDTLTEHAEDITTFLASNFTLQSPFRSELQAEIEERCSGIFLWVVLVIQMLKRDHDKGATRSQLRETLRSLSHELSELFSIGWSGICCSDAMGVVCKELVGPQRTILRYSKQLQDLKLKLPLLGHGRDRHGRYPQVHLTRLPWVDRMYIVTP